jgi:hypothetical protein
VARERRFGTSTASVRFGYDGADMIAEYSATNAVLRRVPRNGREA